MKNGYQILLNKKENIFGRCKDLIWHNITDIDLNKNKMSYYKMIQRLKMYKKNFCQDNQDHQNGDKKEVKWVKKIQGKKMT